MNKNQIDKLWSFYNEAFSELYTIETMIQMTKKSCEENEYSGQYYGITHDKLKQLSAERNSYINMLSLASERITHVINLNLSLEKELTLQQNSNNCC